MFLSFSALKHTAAALQIVSISIIIRFCGHRTRGGHSVGFRLGDGQMTKAKHNNNNDDDDEHLSKASSKNESKPLHNGV